MKFRFLLRVAGCAALTVLFSSTLTSRTYSVAGTEQEQEDATPKEVIKLPINWKKGDQREYRITNQIAKLNSNGNIARATTIENVRISVVDERAQSITVVWTMGAKKIEDPQAIQNPMANEINKIFDGFVMEIEIGKDGYSKGIKNWEEVAEATEKVLEISRNVLRENGMPTNDVEKTIAVAKRTSGSRQAVEHRMTLPLQIMLMPLAGSYSKIPEEYQDELPSPQPGAVMPTIATYQLKAVDHERGTATITWKQRLDRLRVEKVAATRAKLSESNADQIDLPNIVIPPGRDVQDDAEYEIELETGWPVNVASSRVTIIDGKKLKNVTSIEMIKSKQ